MAADDDATDKVLSDPGATVHRRELSSTGGRGGAGRGTGVWGAPGVWRVKVFRVEPRAHASPATFDG